LQNECVQTRAQSHGSSHQSTYGTPTHPARTRSYQERNHDPETTASTAPTTTAYPHPDGPPTHQQGYAASSSRESRLRASFFHPWELQRLRQLIEHIPGLPRFNDGRMNTPTLRTINHKPFILSDLVELVDASLHPDQLFEDSKLVRFEVELRRHLLPQSGCGTIDASGFPGTILLITF